MPAQAFVDALNEQIANEFAASHQYTAIAAQYEADTFPRLAGFFYAQALKERTHAMMMVKYLLDTGAKVVFTAIDVPRMDFEDHVAPIRQALEQERSVSQRISEIFELAREQRDYLSEQFIQWFLKEQVEEEATMSELLEIAERVREQPMELEKYIARENPGGGPQDQFAPEAAGGA